MASLNSARLTALCQPEREAIPDIVMRFIQSRRAFLIGMSGVADTGVTNIVVCSREDQRRPIAVKAGNRQEEPRSSRFAK